MVQPALPLQRAVAATNDVSFFPAGLALAIRQCAWWLVRHREALWVIAILAIAALAHGINMWHFPYYEDDEGTYMSQAWAVVAQGRLAAYTYWYDHAPLGWIQIAAWSVLTGGFHTFGSALESGRVFMLLMQVGSTWMVYRITRCVSFNVLAPTIAALLFALSAYGVYYHRRILLDNICTFWMLLSILLLVSGQFSLKRAWLSAGALGISILSKEVTIFLIPALALLVLLRAHRTNRWFAVIGWLVLVSSIVSGYFLLATLKGELFPTGTWLGGNSPHVSLLGTIQFQASRGKDGGLFDPNSGFWRNMRTWSVEEPMIIKGGAVATFASVLAFRWKRTAGLVGALPLALWAFLARGGEVISFYVIPLIPLLSISIGLVVGSTVHYARVRLKRIAHLPSLLTATVYPLTIALCLSGLVAGYHRSDLLQGHPMLLWDGRQAIAQDMAVTWVRQHVPPQSIVIIDQYMWVDLHDGPAGAPDFPNAHYYWKVDADPAIRAGVFHDTWRSVDYVIETPQMAYDNAHNDFPVVNGALAHSTVLARFNTGGWEIEVRKVDKHGKA